MKIFYHILLNTVFAGVTNFTVWFALTFFVFLQTHSVFATSMISGFFLITTALTGFWLGSIVDHNPKKHVMLFSSFFSFIIYAICFGIYLSNPLEAFSSINSPVLWVFAPLLLIGVIAGNLRNIALPTLVTILVEADQRDKANGLVGTTNGIGFMITSVISGFLVGHSSMPQV